MKITFFALSMMLSCLCFAAKPEKEKKTGGPAGDRPNKEEILKKFDKDGDGKLNEEEKAQARKTMTANRRVPPFVLEKFDKDGDGELNDEEKAEARKAMEERRKEMIGKFDKDGDGKLNEEERKAAMAERSKPGEKAGGEKPEGKGKKPEGKGKGKKPEGKGKKPEGKKKP